MIKGYKLMKIEGKEDVRVYKIEWKEVVRIVESGVIRSIRI